MTDTLKMDMSVGGMMMDWDEATVQIWMAGMGLGQYEEVVIEQGITGDVLAVMDHSSLIDLGITSVGHRLNLLRGVWELKQEQGVEFGDDDWQPKEVPDAQVQREAENVRRLWDMIVEQNERLVNLERDHARMLTTLAEHGLEIPVASSSDGDLERLQARRQQAAAVGKASSNGNVHQAGLASGSSSRGLGRSGSLKLREQGTRSDEEQDTASGRKANRRTSMLFPPSLGSASTSNLPLSSTNLHDPFPPNQGSSTQYSVESPTDYRSNAKSQAQAQAQGQLNLQGRLVHQLQPLGPGPSQLQANKPTSLQRPPFSRLISETSILGAPGPSPPPLASATPPSAVTSLGPSAIPNSSAGSNSRQAPPALSSSTAAAGPSENDKSRAKDAAHSAAKSFRVTLEDPCWKVLPAALKKYKINDDWKVYALFICFGNTERCLSYDEKPLLLFQKLKESGQKPVFMLRHIRDIKSPITVAQQKQATKLGLPPGSAVDVLPKIRPASESSASPTKSGTLQPNSTTAGRDDGRAFPELPSPRFHEGEGMSGSRSAGVMGTLVDKDGNVTNVTYAVAIYPYIADRQDEFDVAVGATFVILSKAKGWYIVQKDPEGQGKIVPDQSKSGWVPAGCLLELSSPIGLASPVAETNLTYPGLSPLPPTAIMSSSYPGLVLMDYEAKGDDELNLKEGERVKVYKKYCHWSYTIKQNSGERGWVPAWFIGKVGGSTSNPTSASAAGSASMSSISASGPNAGLGVGSGSGSGGSSMGNSTAMAISGSASGSGLPVVSVPMPNTALTEAVPTTAATPREGTGGMPGTASSAGTSGITPSTGIAGGSGEGHEDGE